MIEVIYNELRQNGVVGSSNEFSKEWLGMEKSYLRCLRAKQRQPSTKAIAACAARLKHLSNTLSSSNKPKLSAAGATFDKLADKCIEEILHSAKRARHDY